MKGGGGASPLYLYIFLPFPSLPFNKCVRRGASSPAGSRMLTYLLHASLDLLTVQRTTFSQLTFCVCSLFLTCSFWFRRSRRLTCVRLLSSPRLGTAPQTIHRRICWHRNRCHGYRGGCHCVSLALWYMRNLLGKRRKFALRLINAENCSTNIALSYAIWQVVQKFPLATSQWRWS